MKTLIAFMFASVAMAATAQAQTPAAPPAQGGGGQKIPLAEGLRRSYNTMKMNLTEKTKTTRADIIQALADSFAFCDPVFANLTDQSATELVRQGQNEVARGSVLTNLIAHGNEEYGILTVYMRTKGMVPPSTERGMRGRGAAAAPATAPPARGQ
jgi:hypothetical protein